MVLIPRLPGSATVLIIKRKHALSGGLPLFSFFLRSATLTRYGSDATVQREYREQSYCTVRYGECRYSTVLHYCTTRPPGTVLYHCTGYRVLVLYSTLQYYTNVQKYLMLSKFLAIYEMMLNFRLLRNPMWAHIIHQSSNSRCLITKRCFTFGT
jgi:hypothetical protein